MRLRIRPGLVLAWRAPGRLQVGLHTRHRVILDGLDPADEHLVDLLLSGGHDLPSLAARAVELGSSHERVHELVSALVEAGALVHAPTPRRRLASLAEPVRARLAVTARALSLDDASGGDGWDLLLERQLRSVAVVGAGRTGLAVAVGLATAGVGTVVVVDEERVGPHDVRPGGYRDTDLGRERATAAAEVLHRHAPGVVTSVVGRHRPDLAVLTGTDVLDSHRYDGLLREDVPHLPVVLREDDAVLGPLVRPGRTCCLRCLDLYRTDRDADWPRVASQVANRPERGHPPHLCDLVALLAVTQALAELDRRPTDPVTLGCSLEVRLDDPLPVLRAWPAHPRCGCHGPPPSAGRAPTRTMGR